MFFGLFYTFGIATNILLQLKTNNTPLKVIFGMIAQTFLTTVAAFFVPIGATFFACNLFLGIILFILLRQKIRLDFTVFITEINALSLFLKIILSIILITALQKCAQTPFILDNESYYIQTIKWINEFGFVKGLANLNIAFGQTSGWHVLQAATNFSFLCNRFNDLNGFVFLIICSFIVMQFQKDYEIKKKSNWLIFILIFNVLTFQFLNAPSPDLPVFLLVQLVFFMFLDVENAIQNDKIMIVLIAFLIFIKITIAPIALLFLFFKLSKKSIQFLLIITTLFATLWLTKNSVTTGFPFYPYAFCGLNVDWAVPQQLLANINNMIRNHEFLSINNYAVLTVFEKFNLWIRFSGINGVFNKGIIILFIIVPFLKKFRTDKNIKILYIILLIHFLLVFCSSPQFRFFLPEFVFLSCILASEMFDYFKLKYVYLQFLIFVAVILPVFLIHFINLKALTSNKFNQDAEKVTLLQLLLPEENSKFYDLQFQKVRLGNLVYFSPINCPFMYATADGKLPTVNQKQIRLFEKKLQIVPQLRGKSLKNGFVSKNISLTSKP